VVDWGFFYTNFFQLHLPYTQPLLLMHHMKARKRNLHVFIPQCKYYDDDFLQFQSLSINPPPHPAPACLLWLEE
jgi:hypothetical protein